MTSVKVNVFVVHAPEDKAVAELLLEWLYPMRDEVNVWHYDPPAKPLPLPLSWRLLLPWYRPLDPGKLYAESTRNRRENAHIYVFLASENALKDQQFEADFALALNRRLECERENLAPLILPVLLDGSRIKTSTRLAEFEPLAGGRALNKFTRKEDGYLMVTNQISALVKVMQVRLNEARFYQYHPEKAVQGLSLQSDKHLPYLGENPEQFEFNPPTPFRPADWVGWSLIALIFTISMGDFRKNHPAVSALHLKARPDKEREMEYQRPIPMMPPPGNAEIVLPPVE